MNKIFFGMPIIASVHGVKKLKKLISYHPWAKTVVLASTLRATDRTVHNFDYVKFEDGSDLDWPKSDIPVGTVPPKTVIPVKMREKKKVEPLSDFLERRLSQWERYTEDMLLEDGNPNWRAKEFFGYKVRSPAGFAVRLLINERLTYKQLVKRTEQVCEEEGIKFELSKLKECVTALSRGEPGWCPPGLGKFIAMVSGELKILYDTHYAKLEHEKFCEIIHPWFKYVNPDGSKEWRSSKPKEPEKPRKKWR